MLIFCLENRAIFKNIKIQLVPAYVKGTKNMSFTFA